MPDVMSTAERSALMAKVKGKNTTPEMLVRKALFAAGFRFRLHRKDLPGCPDIVLPRHRVVVFVHGCFWHAHQGCPRSKLPGTRQEFWRDKQTRNAARDAASVQSLHDQGWRVLVVWECALRRRQGVVEMAAAFSTWLESGAPTGEIDARTFQALR